MTIVFQKVFKIRCYGHIKWQKSNKFKFLTSYMIFGKPLTSEYLLNEIT